MSNTISSSNYYSVSTSNSSNNGISGLMSGMDTESMVKQMLSGTQSKIDKLNQQKQQIDWKTEIYHDVISTINTFRGTYVDTSYDSSMKNNLASASFFNTMKSAITSGSSVKIVSTDTSAQARDMSIKVNQLATAAKLDSTVRMSGDQSIKGGDIMTEELERMFSVGGDLSFDLTLDGVTKTITLKASDFEGGEVTAESVTDVVKERTKQAFGSYVSVNTEDGALKFSVNIFDGEGNVETGHELKITGASSEILGIKAGSSSLISGLTSLGSLSGAEGEEFNFTINGEKFSFTSDTSISAMMNAVNKSNAGVRLSYSSMTDTFSIESAQTGAQYGIEISQEKGNVLSLMFGQDVISAPSGSGEAGTLAAGAVTAGKDALIEINGVSTSRSSNTFTIDGLTVTAVKEDGEETIIGTERDVDTIVDGIKSFVNDYNAMIKKLTSLISEKAEFRSYAPLTDAQKAEMSEKQIEQWEAKAKTGLVRNDSDISQFVDAMKSIAYMKTSASGIGLYSIGIDTKAWDTTGQLEIDEVALRNAIVNDPDTVRTLFIDNDPDSAVKGIAAQIAEASDRAAKISSADTGALVRLAGAENWKTGEKNNDLYFDLVRINDRLSYLQQKYETERTRYWNQFTQMEKIMANYSTQSNMILQQFGA